MPNLVSKTWGSPEADADLIRMRNVERLPWPKIAAAFDCSKTSVSTRYKLIVSPEDQIKFSSGARYSWSSEDADTLHRLRYDEKKSFIEIAEFFGMTVGQVSSKAERMRIPQKRLHFEKSTAHFIIPQGILDDRARRQNSTRDLTAMFFGDPEPGRSALDRKMVAA